MYCFRLFVSLCLYLTVAFAAQAQQYNFRNWALENGLPQSKVAAIIQDEKNQLWIATRGGVSRFDGTTFYTLTKRQGLSSNNITALFQDSQKQLWIGTADNGLDKYDGIEFTYFNKNNGLSGGGVTSIAEDAKGRIWAATNSGIYILNKDDKSFSLFHLLPRQTYTTLLISEDGSMWAGSKSNGLYKVQGNEVVQFTQANSNLPDNEVTVVSKDNDGRVWVGTAQGVAYLNKDKLQKVKGINSFATGIAFDAYGNTWVAFKADGIVKIKNSEVTFITKKNGLRTNNIVSIASDAENNIWIGTNGYGLQQYRAPWFLHYFNIESAEEPRITAVTKDKRGKVWVGTDNGLVAYMAGNELQQYKGKEWPSNTSLYCLLINNQEDMWIGTSQGAWRIQKGKESHFTVADGLPSDEVRAIVEDDLGTFWLATANGVARFSNNSFMALKAKKDSLGHVYSIFKDSRSNIWFGAEKGIYILKNGKLRKAKVFEEHDVKDVTSIAEDTFGTLYFGAFNYGILVYNPEAKTSNLFSTADGLPNDGVKSLFADKSDYLWVGTNNNMLKLNLPQLRRQQKLSFRRYNSLDGFRGLEVCHNCIIQTSDSTLWFGTAKGLTKYIATLDRLNETKPELLLTDIKLFMRPTDWTKMGFKTDSLTGFPIELKLPFNRNHITFDFHGVSLSNPSRITYRYRLTGYDDNWSDITDVSSATYANLDPGVYTFKAIAQNGDGFWSTTPLTYSFKVDAPFWRREWFMGLMLIVVSGTILAVVRLRERGLKNINKVLDLRVKHRTRLLERKHLEKEMLLKEIHHRVKNNLQIVISLLNLQARHTKDSYSKEAMQAIKSRVRAMSLLHERLYQLDNLAYINLENYIREICESLYNAYGVSEENIELNLRIPPLQLGIDTAITLGLIVNELVSNSLKYAFEQGEQGVISITLEKENSGKYLLTVRDNGKGLPEDFKNQEKNSFGLHLVASLSKTLDGEISFSTDNGTKTILFFTLPP